MTSNTEQDLVAARVESVEANTRADKQPAADYTQFIRFHSHRARDYGLRSLQRKPQAFFSLNRCPSKAGIYLVADSEILAMRNYSKHARFDVLRSPERFNLTPCWEIR